MASQYSEALLATPRRWVQSAVARIDAARATRSEQRWRRLDAERVAKIEQMAALDTERAAKIEELMALNARLGDPWSVRRLLDLVAKNERLSELDAGRVARIEQMAALDAERVAKIEQMAALDAERIAKIKEMEALAAEHVTKIEHMAALDAERVAKIEQMMALDNERLAQLNDLSARSALDRPLVFMHIPKTAGSALIVGLRDVLPSTPYIGGFDLSMFGIFRAFESVAPEMRATIHHGSLPPAESADLVAGHFAHSTLIGSRPTARLMTVLREPGSRILSLWMYWRSLSDGGSWLPMHRLARQPLAAFLNCPEAACQTDNVAVRMLLWPHPLIPDGGFMDSASDERLVDAAAARLKHFALADVIENPRFEENVRALLARPFVHPRVKETAHMRPELRVPLKEEFTGEALRLIEHRSRLDRRLWLTLAGERIAGAEPATLGEEVFRKTVARYEELMA